jgi:hypothetical protein
MEIYAEEALLVIQPGRNAAGKRITCQASRSG